MNVGISRTPLTELQPIVFEPAESGRPDTGVAVSMFGPIEIDYDTVQHGAALSSVVCLTMCPLRT